MCKPRMVRATWDGFFSKKETTEVFEWSTGTMRWCSILLVSHSVHVHSSLPPQFRDEFSFHQFNVCLCVHSYWVSISILEPVWPDNAITTNAHHTVTFSRLSGRYWCSWDWAKKRIFCLFTWPPRVQIFIVTEKKWSPRNQDSLRSADWWFAQRHVSQPYLNRSEVVKSVFCRKQINILVHCAHILSAWNVCRLRQTSCGFPWWLLQTLSHRHNEIFCPDWPWPATATFNGTLYTSRLPEFVQKALCCGTFWSISSWKPS